MEIVPWGDEWGVNPYAHKKPILNWEALAHEEKFAKFFKNAKNKAIFTETH